MEKQRENWMCELDFTFLYALRDSGVTNMWGATTYLEDYDGLEREDAKAVLSQWMHECEVGKTEHAEGEEYNYQEATEYIEANYKQY